jgi:hypothetical protein
MNETFALGFLKELRSVCQSVAAEGDQFVSWQDDFEAFLALSQGQSADVFSIALIAADRPAPATLLEQELTRKESVEADFQG